MSNFRTSAVFPILLTISLMVIVRIFTNSLLIESLDSEVIFCIIVYKYINRIGFSNWGVLLIGHNLTGSLYCFVFNIFK